MKAILVIDIDEIENCDAEVCVYKNDIPYQGFSRIKLKPMPTMNKLEEVNYLPVDWNYFNIGWNSCIKTILGEEE